MTEVSAIIVQCSHCSARFHLAKDRVPAKGARVRCSRCQHRFYVTVDGSVSDTPPARGSSKPVPESPPASAPSEATPGSPPVASEGEAPAQPHESLSEGIEDDEPQRSPWSMRAGPDPEEDTSLENPEFLFDGPGSSSAEPELDLERPGGVDREPSSDPLPVSVSESELPDPSPPEPEPTPPAAPSALESAGGAEEDVPDLRALRDELAAQRAMAALDAAEEEPAPEEAQSERSEDSFVTRNSDAWEDISQSAPTPEAAPSVAPDLADEEDPSEDLWSPTQPPEQTPSGPAPATSTARVERSVEAPRASARFDRLGTQPSAPRRDVIGPLLATIVGLALVLGGGRAVWLGSLTTPPDPERAIGSGWEASDVFVTHVREPSGRTLLVIRGGLEGTGSVPPVSAVLLDVRGQVLSEPYSGWPVRASDTQLENLGLEGLENLWVGRSFARPSGFTIVIPDPDPQARRISLSLG